MEPGKTRAAFSYKNNYQRGGQSIKNTRIFRRFFHEETVRLPPASTDWAQQNMARQRWARQAYPHIKSRTVRHGDCGFLTIIHA